MTTRVWNLRFVGSNHEVCRKLAARVRPPSGGYRPPTKTFSGTGPISCPPALAVHVIVCHCDFSGLGATSRIRTDKSSCAAAVKSLIGHGCECCAEVLSTVQPGGSCVRKWNVTGLFVLL